MQGVSRATPVKDSNARPLAISQTLASRNAAHSLGTLLVGLDVHCLCILQHARFPGLSHPPAPRGPAG